MDDTPPDLCREDDITGTYLIIESLSLFSCIAIDTEDPCVLLYQLAQIVLDLLYPDSYGIDLVPLALRTDDRERSNLTALMTDETLVRCRMIGECDITMRTLLIVTTIGTDPCSRIAPSGIEYERFFVFIFHSFEHREYLR